MFSLTALEVRKSKVKKLDPLTVSSCGGQEQRRENPLPSFTRTHPCGLNAFHETAPPLTLHWRLSF